VNATAEDQRRVAGKNVLGGRDRREIGAEKGLKLLPSSYTKCVYTTPTKRRREGNGNVDRARVYSRMDLEAHEALRNYRISIGLEPELPSAPNPMFSKMGAWIDSLSPWDMFITTTFRPVPRRWGNPRGLAAMENKVKDIKQLSNFRTLRASDFDSSLASRSPSPMYVSGFFDRFIESLQKDCSCRLNYFVGFESGVMSGMNHFHALVSTARADAPFDFWRKGIWRSLKREAGRSLVLPFEKDRGAGWYLAAAYVGKRPLGWDVHVYGRTHLTRRPKPGGHAAPVVPSAECRRDLFHMTHTGWHR
jgi:hypothetical protein